MCGGYIKTEKLTLKVTQKVCVICYWMVKQLLQAETLASRHSPSIGVVVLSK